MSAADAIAQAAGPGIEQSSYPVVTLSLGAAQAAGLCAAAGIGVVSIAARDAGSCRIACQTGAGADELRLRFAGNLLTEPVS